MTDKDKLLQYRFPLLLPSFQFGEKSLSEIFEEHRGVVILFYPSDFLAEYVMELNDFKQIVSSLEDLNIQFLSCSTDSTYSHFAWLLGDFKEDGIVSMGGKLNFSMIGDKTKRFPKLLGVFDESTNTAKHSILYIEKNGDVRLVNVKDNSSLYEPSEILETVTKLLQTVDQPSPSKESSTQDIKSLNADETLSECCSIN